MTSPTSPSASIPSTMPAAPPSITDSTQTSTSSSDMEETATVERRASRGSLRPRLGPRKSSGTMIIPADHPEVEIKSETYPPNDARSFSPRRSPEETQAMLGGKREVVQSHANDLQSGLNAICEKVETIKSSHDVLEKNNNMLQDYIGSLTQSMSRTNLSTGRAADAKYTRLPRHGGGPGGGGVAVIGGVRNKGGGGSIVGGACALCQTLQQVV